AEAATGLAEAEAAGGGAMLTPGAVLGGGTAPQATNSNVAQTTSPSAIATCVPVSSWSVHASSP
ncbi:MAG: hypothetical protein JW940_01570, partial [Polyangiaceae bacterium]|nr:hypothetical protein [Polyangiaceae bacterium]